MAYGRRHEADGIGVAADGIGVAAVCLLLSALLQYKPAVEGAPLLDALEGATRLYGGGCSTSRSDSA